jgi:hypothetical protein
VNTGVSSFQRASGYRWGTNFRGQRWRFRPSSHTRDVVSSHDAPPSGLTAAARGSGDERRTWGLRGRPTGRTSGRSRVSSPAERTKPVDTESPPPRPAAATWATRSRRSLSTSRGTRAVVRARDPSPGFVARRWRGTEPLHPEAIPWWVERLGGCSRRGPAVATPRLRWPQERQCSQQERPPCQSGRQVCAH